MNIFAEEAVYLSLFHFLSICKVLRLAEVSFFVYRVGSKTRFKQHSEFSSSWGKTLKQRFFEARRKVMIVSNLM
jgi:hypothetical protein